MTKMALISSKCYRLKSDRSWWLHGSCFEDSIHANPLTKGERTVGRIQDHAEGAGVRCHNRGMAVALIDRRRRMLPRRTFLLCSSVKEEVACLRVPVSHRSYS